MKRQVRVAHGVDAYVHREEAAVSDADGYGAARQSAPPQILQREDAPLFSSATGNLQIGAPQVAPTDGFVALKATQVPFGASGWLGAGHFLPTLPSSGSRYNAA